MSSKRDYKGQHHTVEMHVVKTKNNRNRRVAAIVLFFLCAVGVVSLAATLVHRDEPAHGTFMSVEKPSSTPQPAPGVSAQTVSYTYLDGVWKSANDKIAMEAVIQSKIIVINWVGNGNASLYWAGSFDVTKGHNGEFDILSVGDTERMKSALLASQNRDKTFHYKNGTFTFKLSIAGTETTIKMTR